MNRMLVRRTFCRPVALLIAGLLLAAPLEASGQQGEPAGRRLDEQRALQMAIVANPTLQAAVFDLKRANESVRFEEGRYPYILQLDAGVTRSAVPTLSAGGGTNVAEGDTIDVGAQLSRTFPTGTRASVRVDGYRDMNREPLEAGPFYGAAARATVTQPLMRGAGSDVGEEQLRLARINRTAAELSRDRVASEVARDVLIAYWELWYAEHAEKIEVAALELAKRQRDEAKQRVEDGALAPVELLPFETRVASLEEGVVSAEAERRRRSLVLSQRMGSPQAFGTNLLAVGDHQPDPASMPLRTAAIQQALASSPEVRELEAQLRLAEEQVRTAGDLYRPRLDLEGYVQVAGLGNEEVPPVFEQMGKARATSVHLGIVYELPLDDARKDSERARTMLAVKIAEQRLLAARQAVHTEVETLIEQERAARIRLELAEKTAEIAEKQVAAETERFEIGVAIAVQVHEAEDELRQAKLRAVRARVDVVEAEIQRQHAMGLLLGRVADELRRGQGGDDAVAVLGQ